MIRKADALQTQESGLFVEKHKDGVICTSSMKRLCPYVRYIREPHSSHASDVFTYYALPLSSSFYALSGVQEFTFSLGYVDR